MAGICGLVSRTPGADLASPLERMLVTLRLYPWYGREQQIDQQVGLALGRSSLGFVNTAPQPARNESATLTGVMDGELYDYEPQRRRLVAAGHHFHGNSHAELLLHGYEEQGPPFFAGLHGKFAAILHDRDRAQLILVNDRFGMKPLYYAAAGDRFYVASEIKALLADGAVSRQLHVGGLAQFFSFGQFLGEDTLLAAVRALPPAAWATYDLRTGQLAIERYWRLAAKDDGQRTQSEYIDLLDARFEQAVQRAIEGTAELGISLSGGLDSRLILALIDAQRTPITSLSLGVAGSLDHRCAGRLAKLAQVEHHSHILNQGFLAGFEQHMRHMVDLTDGHYLSQCIVIPTLDVYRELGIEVLLRGHAGELMHMRKAYNFSLDAEALAIHDEPSLAAWLWRHLRAYMVEGLDGALLTEVDQPSMERLARASLDEALADAAATEPPLQRVWHLFISQRLRRETALSMAEFGSVVETRLPYLDNELIEALMNTPPRLKLGEEIQCAILRRRRPEFLEVVNANTGTRLGAGDWARRFGTFRLKVLSKLRVPGYQPYERLGLWLRRELKPMVENLLLSDRCLGRGVFVPDTVRSVVAQHFEHRRNHTFLLLALMIFELGQRAFIDGDSLSAARLPTEHPDGSDADVAARAKGAPRG